MGPRPATPFQPNAPGKSSAGSGSRAERDPRCGSACLRRRGGQEQLAFGATCTFLSKSACTDGRAASDAEEGGGRNRKLSARSVRAANFLVPSEGVHHSPSPPPSPQLISCSFMVSCHQPLVMKPKNKNKEENDELTMCRFQVGT